MAQTTCPSCGETFVVQGSEGKHYEWKLVGCTKLDELNELTGPGGEYEVFAMTTHHGQTYFALRRAVS
jgi:hypothetical protein